MVDRRSLTMRDMAVAIGILVVSLVLVLGAIGALSFGNDTDGGDAPIANVVGELQSAGPALDMPVLVPAGLPADWQGNSFTQETPFSSGGTRTVVRGGWITGSGNFITLIQSTDSPADLVTTEIGAGLAGQGTVEVAGRSWDVYPGVRDERAWVRVQDSMTLLITGSAGEGDFQLLAGSLG